MPKQTFFNISPEKKQRLLAAACKEFSQVSFNDASINRIIKEAQIPRGSFYQYFEDKQDLYLYFASGMKNELQASFLTSLQHHQGDLFATIKDGTNAMKVNVLSKEYTDFFRLAIESRDYRLLLRELRREKYKSKDTDKMDFLQQVYQNCDLKMLKVETYEEFRALMSLVMTCLVHSLEAVYAVTDKGTKIDGQLVAQKFYWMIDMLQFGAKN
ncbi:TetR family transcriptional regulator [Ligilactobacillus sp. Marseille-Q7487]|uniref:TetR family transcriptional regulator n=1 Tax=Ligilactobacillus sp. Marseille-Q7487 TaxID=3022128 RepID=UPI0024A87ABE|nr:TetR family transcriptional regulator [Ligilactobacillus sp. Marseille-Q7487]